MSAEEPPAYRYIQIYFQLWGELFTGQLDALEAVALFTTTSVVMAIAMLIAIGPAYSGKHPYGHSLHSWG